jgi:hypothetical protein
MVLRGAFSQVAIGLAIGIPAAIGAGKLMTQQLFNVRSWDPVMLASATLTFDEESTCNLDGYLMTGLSTEKSLERCLRYSFD